MSSKKTPVSKNEILDKQLNQVTQNKTQHHDKYLEALLFQKL